MLINEMHHRFEQEVDRISTQDRPDFLPNEIDDYLNKAIWIFLKDRYGFINKVKQGFETNQERIDNLRNLHIKSPQVQPEIAVVDLGNGYYEARLNTLDFRYLFLTDATVKIEKDGCTKAIGHKLWQVDDIKTIYSDSSYEWCRVIANFGRSSDRNIESNASVNEDLGSIFFNTKNKYGVPQFTVTGVCLDYVKYPNEVFFSGYDHINGIYLAASPQVHCDIDAAFHDEIVSIAAQQAMKDIQDKTGYQLQTVKVEMDK
jgi:hypothetical protein